jgi:uncharacterized BrkB/YihY/UPF0761 family membrane protein
VRPWRHPSEWWEATKHQVRSRLERHRFTDFLLQSSDRFEEIEGKHLALVIATNIFVALLPLIIVGFAIIEQFNPHRTVGTVLVDNFHLHGNTATVVKDTFGNARSGRSVALSISLISLLVTGFDISSTVQLAYARAFKMTPMRGFAKYLRGGAWLVLLLVTTGAGLTVRHEAVTRSGIFLALAAAALVLLQFGFFLATPRLLLDLPFAWRDLLPGAIICAVVSLGVTSIASYELHQWLQEYASAYGGFGVALALMAGVGISAVFWVWIATVMAIYWERKAGSAVAQRLEQLSARS